LKKQGLCDGGVPLFLPKRWQIFLRGCSARCPVDRSWCARSAAATELRRSRCCDGAAQTSSVALILRVASRRDALNEEPASFPPGLIQISMVVAHSPRPPPWPRNNDIILNLNSNWNSFYYERYPGYAAKLDVQMTLSGNVFWVLVLLVPSTGSAASAALAG